MVAGSLSKTYAMTGWRIGFVLGPAAVVAGIAKLQSHATSNPTFDRAERRRSRRCAVRRNRSASCSPNIASGAIT